MSHLPGKFVWFEHVSRDAKKAQAFYGEVIGWKVEPFAMGGSSYDMIKAGELAVGGYAGPRGSAGAHWISYVSVADVDATAKAAVAAGGRIVDPPADLPGVGRAARIADPQGAELILFRNAREDRADGRSGPGELFWNELLAPDPKAALAFYEKVIGYTHKEMTLLGEDNVYRVLESSGGPRGGIMKAPMPGPAQWLPYVHVADTDQAVARATRLGAKVFAAPSDIPTIGRFAVLQDPLGAAFAVMKPAS
jgi:predicted enzyme related to lactoylglutathione lyase